MIKNNTPMECDKSTVQCDVSNYQMWEKKNYGKLGYHRMWQKYGHMWNYFGKFLGFGGITVIFFCSKRN